MRLPGPGSAGSRAVTTGLVVMYVTPAPYIIPLYFIFTRLQIIFTLPEPRAFLRDLRIAAHHLLYAQLLR